MARHYILFRPQEVNDDEWWVLADSPEQARRLVALNVPEAAQAEDLKVFDCVQNANKGPPPGVIYSKLNGTFTIKRR